MVRLGRPLLGVTLLLVALLLVAGSAFIARRGDSTGQLQGLVRRHVAAMPDRGSGGYRAPTAGERRAASEAWRLIERGAVARARATLGPFGYTVRTLELSGVGSVTVIAGPGGLFVHRKGGSDLVVEVPHPLADFATEDLGVELFTTARASALLVAGAHRAAAPGEGSDVAHSMLSVFHAMHVAATAPVRTAVQLHGYAQASAPELDVIASSGGAPARDDAAGAVAARLASRFRTCRWAPDSPPPCRELGGTTNAQGRQARGAGRAFVHLEVGRKVRTDPALRRVFAREVATALRGG